MAGRCKPVTALSARRRPVVTAAERLWLIREALEVGLPLGMRIALPRDLDELAEDVLEVEGMTRSRPRWGSWPSGGGGMRP